MWLEANWSTHSNVFICRLQEIPFCKKKEKISNKVKSRKAWASWLWQSAAGRGETLALLLWALSTSAADEINCDSLQRRNRKRKKKTEKERKLKKKEKKRKGYWISVNRSPTMEDRKHNLLWQSVLISEPVVWWSQLGVACKNQLCALFPYSMFTAVILTDEICLGRRINTV